MTIILQTFLGSDWYDAAEVDFEIDNHGYLSPSHVGYEIDYYARHGSADYADGHPAIDHRAVSTRNPVDLVDRYTSRWPPFLLDLLPQGHARIRLAKALGLDPEARSSDLPLLMRSAGSTIGNVRIKEAAEEEEKRLNGAPRAGLSDHDLIHRTDLFVEVVDRHSMIASGSSGLQGEWPKVALTKSRDGLYYPDPLVADEDAVEHVIVKLRRGGEVDGLILSMEATYSVVASQIGLNVYGVASAGNGTLVIPRFDRRVVEGRTVRIGQESMTSAVGVSEFGHIDEHERYVGILKAVSADPQADVLEYLKRDAANLAMGNPDNHGRNTALSKYPDGSIRLAPLYDFAPMKLAGEVIARSTRWRCLKDFGSDYSPDWSTVCAAVSGDTVDGRLLAEELAVFADALEDAPRIAVDRGAPLEAVEQAAGRCSEVVDGLRRTLDAPSLIRR
ncbi:type II toxin-antitoxin system HipA family toxin [Tianweitania populi]|uniref:Phosphatidylinositol kinase n=1 Tax=Tianweitania populi TaxID=1607949 RepID=A0A8J3DR80_9HYPH|nr:HipA domain-containing protein [Tianweitania populi]GHD20943.1 phosphatidylinositol kinase [Tianweitania populi]